MKLATRISISLALILVASVWTASGQTKATIPDATENSTNALTSEATTVTIAEETNETSLPTSVSEQIPTIATNVSKSKPSSLTLKLTNITGSAFNTTDMPVTAQTSINSTNSSNIVSTRKPEINESGSIAMPNATSKPMVQANNNSLSNSSIPTTNSPSTTITPSKSEVYSGGTEDVSVNSTHVDKANHTCNDSHETEVYILYNSTSTPDVNSSSVPVLDKRNSTQDHESITNDSDNVLKTPVSDAPRSSSENPTTQLILENITMEAESHLQEKTYHLTNTTQDTETVPKLNYTEPIKENISDIASILTSTLRPIATTLLDLKTTEQYTSLPVVTDSITTGMPTETATKQDSTSILPTTQSQSMETGSIPLATQEVVQSTNQPPANRVNLNGNPQKNISKISVQSTTNGPVTTQVVQSTSQPAANQSNLQTGLRSNPSNNISDRPVTTEPKITPTTKDQSTSAHSGSSQQAVAVKQTTSPPLSSTTGQLSSSSEHPTTQWPSTSKPDISTEGSTEPNSVEQDEYTEVVEGDAYLSPYLPFEKGLFSPPTGNQTGIEIVVSGDIRITEGAKWNIHLLNSKSLEFAQLAAKVKQELIQLFGKTKVHRILEKIEILEFKEGSVRVLLNLHFRTTNHLLSEKFLRDQFHNHLVDKNKLGTYTIDIDRTHFKVSRKDIPNVSAWKEDDPSIPQWAIAVIVVTAACLIFSLMFAAVTKKRHEDKQRNREFVYGRSKSGHDLSYDQEGIVDACPGWEKKLAAAYENLAADTLYERDEAMHTPTRKKSVASPTLGNGDLASMRQEQQRNSLRLNCPEERYEIIT